MLVSELIEKLQKLNPNFPVKIYTRKVDSMGIFLHLTDIKLDIGEDFVLIKEK